MTPTINRALLTKLGYDEYADYRDFAEDFAGWLGSINFTPYQTWSYNKLMKRFIELKEKGEI